MPPFRLVAPASRFRFADVDEFPPRGTDALSLAGRQAVDVVDRFDMEAGPLEPSSHICAVVPDVSRMAERLLPRLGIGDRRILEGLGELSIHRHHDGRLTGGCQHPMEFGHRLEVVLDVLEHM